MKTKPIIVAHRGLHREAPENSLRAFELAAQAGVKWVECDVWDAPDAVIVLHDDTLDRTTTGVGPFRSLPWKELSGLRMRYADGSTDEASQLPRLQDLIAITGQRGDSIGLLVEIKPVDSPQVMRKVGELLSTYPGKWMVQSFDERNLIHCRGMDAGIPMAFLVEDRAALERGLAGGWKNIHLLHELLDEPTAQRLRAAGVSIGVWTPNSAQDLRRVIELGAAMIITDEPLLAAELAGETREPA